MPLSPVKPRRRSVTPVAIQIRVPAGSPIIATDTRAPPLAPLHLPNPQYGSFPSTLGFPSFPSVQPGSPTCLLLQAAPPRPLGAAVPCPPHLPTGLRGRASASRTTGSHSHHAVVPLSIARCPAKASLLRSPVALESFGAASLALGPEALDPVCPRFLFVDTNLCAHKTIIVNHSCSVNTVGSRRLPVDCKLTENMRRSASTIFDRECEC
jgi:hypothetical protein